MTLDDNESASRASRYWTRLFGESELPRQHASGKRTTPRRDTRSSSRRHDYLIAYAKDKSPVSFTWLGRDNGAPEHYTMVDNDERNTPWKPLQRGGQHVTTTGRRRPTCHFALSGRSRRCSRSCRTAPTAHGNGEPKR